MKAKFSMNFKWFLTLVCVLPPNLSCGGMLLRPEKKKSKTSFERLILTHGDPMSLVLGSELNAQPFLKEDTLDAWNGVKMGTWVVFRQTTPSDEVKEKTNIEEGQEATKKNDTEELDGASTWTFEKTGADSYRLKMEKQKLFFNWRKNQQGLLEFVGIKDLPVSVLHYSVNEQKKLMSFLLKKEDASYGTVLIKTSFYKPTGSKKAVEETDPQFNYLLGEGVKTTWPEDLTLSVCGALSPEHRAHLNLINEAWVRQAKIGQRKFTLDPTPQKKPFSDVNNHCILFTDAYEFTVTKTSFVGGVTIPTLDPSSQAILDSDMIIFTKPFQKHFGRYPDYLDEMLRNTVLHEMGHWLGLDHEFDADAKYKSIMSYEGIDGVQPYDLEAIEKLYGRYDFP